jgi:hypothetical protein
MSRRGRVRRAALLSAKQILQITEGSDWSNLPNRSRGGIRGKRQKSAKCGARPAFACAGNDVRCQQDPESPVCAEERYDRQL